MVAIVCVDGAEQPNLFQVVGTMSDVWRIFVVEGEEALNRSLVSSLQKDGYVVQGAISEADAVRTLWTEEYDVVICDLKTSASEGFELLQWLRLFRPDIQMIMLGAADDSQLRSQALESGAVSYLEKPLDLRVLKDELRRLLQQTGFSASLDSFDLLDVIQIINMSRKSIALLVNTGLEEHGALRFQNGELVWAEYGILRGEEAFFALAAHKNGTVIQQPDFEQGLTNVTQPLSRLIFQALQYRTKYADRLQWSGEVDAVPKPTFAVTGDEEDDSPFLFFEEQEDQEGQAAQQAQWQYAEDETPMQALNPEPQMATNTDSKEWWEPTGGIARVDRDVASVPPTLAFGGAFATHEPEKITPSLVQKTPASQRADLPSWLTDQPTASALPVVRPPSLTSSAQVPVTPAMKPSSPEWQSPLAAMNATEQLSPQLPISSQAMPVQEGAEAQLANPTQWTQSGLRQSSSPASREMSPVDEMQDSNPMLSTSMLHAQRAARRNYTALVSALQTLGYSITGFVAAAVVGIEGQPIAQVAVDDLDISKLCKNFSSIQKNVLQALTQGVCGDYENTIITSAEGHILMRVVGSEKKAFQVLITTREANPVESLEVMANVEGAISAALR